MILLVLLLLAPIAHSGELEVASQIIERIAVALTGRNPVLVYAEDSYERRVIEHSRRMVLTESCIKAELLLLANEHHIVDQCREKKVFFTHYKPFKRYRNGVAAFFWQKGRVNILFLRSRIERFNITLPKKWNEFVETEL